MITRAQQEREEALGDRTTLQVAESRRRMTRLGTLEVPGVPTARRRKSSVRQLRDAVEELETGFSGLDLVQGTTALLNIEQSLGEVILDMGLSQIYPELMNELYLNNASFLFCAEDEALEAAQDRPNTRVVLSAYGGGTPLGTS